MYVRVTRGRTAPAEAAEWESLSEDLAVALTKLPGFLSYVCGLDRRTGDIVAITTWETEKQAHFQRDCLGDVYRHMVDLAELEAAEIYEVLTKG
jgi:hypothetical protein